ALEAELGSAHSRYGRVEAFDAQVAVLHVGPSHIHHRVLESHARYEHAAHGRAAGNPGDGPGGRLRGSGSGGERGEIPAPAPLYQLDLGVLKGDAAHFDAEGEKRLDTHPHPHLAHADEGCRAEAWVVGDLETLEADVGEREQGDG